MVAPGGAVYDCGECCAADPDNLPPCDKCPLPWTMPPEVENALDAWKLADRVRRLPDRITPADMKAICDGLEYGPEIFRLAVHAESLAYPMIMEEIKRGAES